MLAQYTGGYSLLGSGVQFSWLRNAISAGVLHHCEQA